mgnify:CR=1 FL=1
MIFEFIFNRKNNFQYLLSAVLDAFCQNDCMPIHMQLWNLWSLNTFGYYVLLASMMINRRILLG